MKKLRKILIIIIVLLVVIAAADYIDYFIAKSRNTYPKISIKKELSDESIVYNAILYKVWYCKTNDTYTIGSYNDKDAICPHNYEYVDGYYTNSLGIKISKKDLQMISSYDIYTTEMIDNMSSEAQINSAVHVAKEYVEKTKYKTTGKKTEDGIELVVFPSFTLNKDTGDYSFTYDIEDEKNYWCLNNNGVATYNEGVCGEFKKIKMDEEWCSSYENSTLVYENKIADLCKE